MILALLLILAQAPDAPVEPRPAQVFKAGEIVPYDGVCMTDERAILTGKRLAAAEASVAATDGKLVLAPGTVVAAVAVVVAVVAGASAAAYVAGKGQ